MNKPTLSKLIAVGIFTTATFSSIVVPGNSGTISGNYYTGGLAKHKAFANSGAFKYAGAVLINEQSCSGVLILPRYVLTSAHCLNRGKFFDTVFGQFRLNNSSLKANIVGAVVHEEWNLFGSTISLSNVPSSVFAAENDIAVLLLDRELRPTSTVVPFFSSLYPTGLSRVRVKFDTVGFGKRGDGAIPEIDPYNPNEMLGGQNNAVVSAGFGSYSQAIYYDMDLVFSDGNTSNTRNSDGEPGLPLEYLPAGGDSGSPLYVGTFLFGLHSRRQYVTYFGLNAFLKGRFGNIGFATPLAVHAEWISNVVDGLKPTKPVGTRPKGVLIFRVGSAEEGDADPGTIEIDASEIPFQYSVTPDIFDKVASPERLFSAFSSEVALSVTNGQPGTNVVISGSRFTDATSVAFNGISASFRVDTDTQITATVPAGASTGLVTVVTPLGTAKSTTDFKPTLAAATLTSFSPTSGAVGSTVRIAGSGLQGVSSVVFYNGKTSNFIVVNQDGTEITAIVPNGAVSGKFQLYYPNGRLVSPSKFIVTP